MKFFWCKLLQLTLLCFYCNLLNAQEVGRNSIEFTSQISLTSFSAEQTKIVGPIFSGELTYHFDQMAHPKKWMEYLSLNSIDVALIYQNNTRAKAIFNEVSYPVPNSYSLTSGLTFSLYHARKSNLYFSAGAGLGYFDKTSSPEQGVVLGSRINYSSKFQLKAERSISLKSRLSLMLGFYHLSNGGMRIPNKGVNVIMTGLGFKHYLRPKTNSPVNAMTDNVFETNYKKHSFDFGVAIGATGTYAANKLLYKTDFYAGYNYKVNSMLGLSFGADAIYNFTAYDINRHYETYQGYASSPDKWRLGLGIGPDLWLGRFAVMAKFGRYVSIKASEARKPIYAYNTLGFKYHFTNWLAAQTKVHLHKTEAEFVGFGLIFNR